jgi:peroxiredoxin
LFLIQPAIADEYEDLMKMLEIKKDLPLEQKKFIAEEIVLHSINLSLRLDPILESYPDH